jgi:hypothetical protein
MDACGAKSEAPRQKESSQKVCRIVGVDVDVCFVYGT